MMNRNKKTAREVRKPFLQGDVIDEKTIRNCLTFFGIMIMVIFISFIVCAAATFSSFILRLLMNSAVIIVLLMIFYHKGSGHGTDAVARGEILYQKQEKGQTFSESERKMCFHPMKGFVTGALGTLPFLIAALILALNTSVQMTQAGGLPSWMQAYLRRDDIGNALVSYTQPETMALADYLRAVIRIVILPFVNIVSYENKTGMVLLERLSPVIMLLPAIAYGAGYMKGKSIRTKIHTVISENDRKRIRREKKRSTRAGNPRKREPEQLN